MAQRRNGATVDDIARAYRAHLGEFCSVAAAIVQDTEEGKDVVQEAFAVAVRERASYRGDGSLEAWLWRTVVNTARSRRRKRVPVPSSSLADDGIAERDGAGAEVRDVLAQLPERQRVVLYLRYYADLDYRTVAAALGISPGTVAATINAALASLRRRMEEVAG